MYVLGTAGHIDHGKSTLIKSLTGTDPDRLAEEKKRGMTIDLGFAWLKLPRGTEIGIVDVPGHERFIRNMLAGAGGIDIALLVIAANEGIMPQTREHLAILDLLGISSCVVAITKKDLVDAELLGVLKLEIEELLKPTSFANSPVVAVSALTGEHLTDLLQVIEQLLLKTPPRIDKGKPRLPIDRVFSITGAGTVVTGTLIDGLLNVGQELEIVPSGLPTRIRGLQTHKMGVNTIEPGSRTAVNLTNIDVGKVQRGDVLTTPQWLQASTLLSAKIRLLPSARYPLKHNAERSVYILSAEAMVRVRLLDKEVIDPGESSWVQLILDRPVAAIAGDRFILRSTTETLGGGMIVEANAHRFTRFHPDVIESLRIKEQGSPLELMIRLLNSKNWYEKADILRLIPAPPSEVEKNLTSLINDGLVLLAGWGNHSIFIGQARWRELVALSRQILNDFHRQNPLKTGMPQAEFSRRLTNSTYGSQIVERLLQDEVIKGNGTSVSLPEFKIRLTADQSAATNHFLARLEENPCAPTPGYLEPELLSVMLERHQIVKLSESVIVSAKAFEMMKSRIVACISEKGSITLAETRDLFKTSRKYALAMLEYLDGEKITRRSGDERKLF